MKKILFLLCALALFAVNPAFAQQVDQNAQGLTLNSGGASGQYIYLNGNVAAPSGSTWTFDLSNMTVVGNATLTTLVNGTLNGTTTLAGGGTLTGNTGNTTLTSGNFRVVNGNLALTNGSISLGNSTQTINGKVRGITANIDATAAANSTIYTPPGATNFRLTSVTIIAANVNTLSVAPVLHFAAGATTTNITANLTATGLANGTYFQMVPLTTVLTNCNATVPLTLNISTGATATNATIQVIYEGDQR